MSTRAPRRRRGRGATGAGAAIDVYLVVLLAAAARRRAARSPSTVPRPEDRLTFAVLVPAHDEEATIAATIASLRRLAYPPERWSLAVIADNCADATATIARAAGATVLERDD